MRGFEDFAIWYSPGVAAPARAIAADPDAVWVHANRANTIAIVRDGILEDLRVKDAMTCNRITARPDMPVAQAAALMLEARIGSLPVIENGKLVGIVTDRDAVKALAMYVPALKYVAEPLW